MKQWKCDKCRVVVENERLPIGWTLNLFDGVQPICHDCQPYIECPPTARPSNEPKER